MYTNNIFFTYYMNAAASRPRINSEAAGKSLNVENELSAFPQKAIKVGGGEMEVAAESSEQAERESSETERSLNDKIKSLNAQIKAIQSYGKPGSKTALAMAGVETLDDSEIAGRLQSELSRLEKELSGTYNELTSQSPRSRAAGNNTITQITI